MHRLTKMDIKKTCNKYVDDIVIDNLNKWINIYNKMDKDSVVSLELHDTEDYLIVSNIKKLSKEYLENFVWLNKYEVFMKIISNCPAGLEKWMGISTNYMQLKTIYQQRKSHRLKEDYTSLCDMIENLPYFKKLCLGADRND